jgi:aspartate/methionine/tyrosine aminotransferase
MGLERLLKAGEEVRRQILHRVHANREFLDQSRTGEATWECLRTEGGWSAVLRLPKVMSELQWAMTLLEKDRVLVHPGYFYDFVDECYLVVSLLPPEDVFREGIGRLLKRVKAAAG